MRTLATLTAAFVLLAPVGVAHAVGENDPYRDDGTLRWRFYVEGEFLGVERGDTSSRDVSFIAGSGVLETDDVVADDWDFGGRGLFGMRIDEKQSVEAVFLGWGHEDSESVTTGLDNIRAFDSPDLFASTGISDSEFDEADRHELDFESSFYSGELNYRRNLEVDGADYRFRLLAGLRAIRIEDDLELRSNDELPSPGPATVGRYDVATRNTLIGAQVGIEGIVPLWEDRLDLNLYTAAGGYANQTRSFTDYANGLGGDEARFSHDDWTGSGVLEGAAHLKVRLWRGVRMTLGYRAVYFLGVAVAEDQFAKSGSGGDFNPGLDDEANLLFHGPSVGLSVDF